MARRRRLRARKTRIYRGRAGIRGPLDKSGTFPFHSRPAAHLTRHIRGGTKRRMGALGVQARHRSQVRAAFSDR